MIFYQFFTLLGPRGLVIIMISANIRLTLLLFFVF